jgi:hypothetical protein
MPFDAEKSSLREGASHPLPPFHQDISPETGIYLPSDVSMSLPGHLEENSTP